MAPLREPSRWPLAAVQAGVVLFIGALVISAVLEPAVGVLHTLQALIYVAVIALARRESAWGFGGGFAIALAWNGANLFATGFIPAGIDALRASLRTGHLARPDLLLVLVAASGHFLMIFGCLAGFLYRNPKLRPWAQFLGGAVLAVSALALIRLPYIDDLPHPLDIRQRPDPTSATAAAAH